MCIRDSVGGAAVIFAILGLFWSLGRLRAGRGGGQARQPGAAQRSRGVRGARIVPLNSAAGERSAYGAAVVENMALDSNPGSEVVGRLGLFRDDELNAGGDGAVDSQHAPISSVTPGT